MEGEMDFSRFKVVVSGNLNGEIPSDNELIEAAVEAGWSDDPGTGRAILIADERGAPGYEVLNPIPHSPPIGWEPTPPIDQLIRERVKAEFARLKEDEEVDDIVDAEDFDISEELPDLNTIYEFAAMEDEAPREKPVEVSREERIRDELEYEELKDRERRLRVLRAREEYDRRRREEDALYGPSEAVQGALNRAREKGA